MTSVAPTKRRIAFHVLRILRILAVTLGVVLTSVFSLVGGVLLELDLPSAHSFAIREVNTLLAPQFKGQIHIDRLRRLSIFGVNGLDATVTAIDGTRVLVAKGGGGEDCAVRGRKERSLREGRYADRRGVDRHRRGRGESR